MLNTYFVKFLILFIEWSELISLSDNQCENKIGAKCLTDIYPQIKSVETEALVGR